MPRHTHPKAISKHSRAYTRAQARRYSNRRWNTYKQTYFEPVTHLRPKYGFIREYDEKENREVYRRTDNPIDNRLKETTLLQEVTGSPGPVFYVHSDQVSDLIDVMNEWWLFKRGGGGRNLFARNPFTHCSCEMCSTPRYERRRAKRSERQNWRNNIR